MSDDQPEHTQKAEKKIERNWLKRHKIPTVIIATLVTRLKQNKVVASIVCAILAIIILCIIATAKSNNNGTVQDAAKTSPSSYYDPSSNSSTDATQNNSSDDTGNASSSTAPTSTPAATTTPAPTHTVSYQFTLMSGHLSAADMGNVGISWHNPSNGQNELPDNGDPLAAIQQISTSGYTVTFNVANVNDNNLYSSVNNYGESDASINCTILVDNQMVSSETAPRSGYADCAANGEGDSGAN